LVMRCESGRWLYTALIPIPGEKECGARDCYSVNRFIMGEGRLIDIGGKKDE